MNECSGKGTNTNGGRPTMCGQRCTDTRFAVCLDALVTEVLFRIFCVINNCAKNGVKLMAIPGVSDFGWTSGMVRRIRDVAVHPGGAVRCTGRSRVCSARVLLKRQVVAGCSVKYRRKAGFPV
uniref:(northern house mosquito) hypothetical protein n=1 Tax=Culex pipiens TaxID=7175 RepID=A0A8D8FPN2_CULPI